MGNSESLNRRSAPTTRLIQDRPHGQERQLLWKTVKAQEQDDRHLTENEITRTVKKYAAPQGKCTDKQRREKNGNATDSESRWNYGEPQRKQDIPENAWKLVDTRTILIQTYLQQPHEEDRANQKIRTYQAESGTEQIDLLTQDDLVYADDAALFIGKEDREQLCERMGNYDIATETSELEIHWGEVSLLIHASRKPTADLPPPIDRIDLSTGGTIIGEVLYMTCNLIHAAEAIIKRANIIQPENQDPTTGLPNQKHNDIWTAHQVSPATPALVYGNLHV